VNLGFERPGDQIWVSIRGTAELVRDREKIDELWEPTLKPWFPEGKHTDDLALLKVRAHGAEYWDGTESTTEFVFESVKAAATGAPPDVGDNQKVSLE
jgi:general stress protein 26